MLNYVLRQKTVKPKQMVSHFIAHLPHANCSWRASLSCSFQHLRMGYTLTTTRTSIFRQVTNLTGSTCSLLQGNVSKRFLNYNSHKAPLTRMVVSNSASTYKETKAKKLLAGGCVKVLLFSSSLSVPGWKWSPISLHFTKWAFLLFATHS